MKRKKNNNVINNTENSNITGAPVSELYNVKSVTNEELIQAVNDGADIIMKAARGGAVRIKGIKPVKGFEDFINRISGKNADNARKEVVKNMTEIWTPESLNKEKPSKEKSVNPNTNKSKTSNKFNKDVIFTSDKKLNINIIFKPNF